uniref:NADH dehydrogenase [ubiquinone] 1 beta subcomplex subunit 2, mitochondrial n=1 Tax=Gasterosteus aculeatus aculeatus TaxID=481459 RepID=A0AAQ4P496_GASAC
MSSFGRVLGVLRTGTQLLRRSTQKITNRKASGGPHIEPQYRQYPQLTKKQKLESELLSGAMWFWILWHCWHDPDAIMMRSSESQQMTRNKITRRDSSCWMLLCGNRCSESQCCT